MLKTVDDFLSVTELNQELNANFNEHFANIRFEGEISEITFARSGHIYFTLKDADSQLQSAMWRSNAERLKFEPKAGLLVQCIGTANIYNKSGRFQMLVSKMREAGEGGLQQKYLELKNKLEKEGLFDEQRKRELPFFPKTVGIVTSGTGAALQDILVKIRKRAKGTKVILADAKVQGPGAKEDIVKGIKKLNEDGRAEVIIIGRGGGSLEDLFAFNEEEVVRAVFSSRIPIISAVGHEVDIALSDLAADVRAPTPTAAGVMVVPDCTELLGTLVKLEERLLNYERWLAPIQQLVDEKEEKLFKLITYKLKNLALEITAKENSLKSIKPGNLINSKLDELKSYRKRLNLGIKINFEKLNKDLKHKRVVIESLSQKNILKRGFSIVKDEDGKIVSSAKQLKKEQQIEINFDDSKAKAKVL